MGSCGYWISYRREVEVIDCFIETNSKKQPPKHRDYCHNRIRNKTNLKDWYVTMSTSLKSIFLIAIRNYSNKRNAFITYFLPAPTSQYEYALFKRDRQTIYNQTFRCLKNSMSWDKPLKCFFIIRFITHRFLLWWYSS